MKRIQYTKFTILTAISFGTLLCSAGAETLEKTYQFSYPYNPDQLIQLSVRDADVEVLGDAALQQTTITVLHTTKGLTEEQAELFFEQERIESSSTGALIKVENAEKHPQWDSIRGHGKRHTSISISCPVGISAQLASSDGDLTLSNIRGELKMRSSDGDVKITRVSGPIEIGTSDGDVIVDNAQGVITAKTSDGDVIIHNLAGSVNAQTSDGDIEITMASDPAGPCAFKTSDGNVSLIVESPVSLMIRAQVADGNIHCQLKDSQYVEQKRHSQTIKVGNGDISIDIKTSDGDVLIGS